MIQAQPPRRQFPHPQPFVQSSLTHYKVTSNIPLPRPQVPLREHPRVRPARPRVPLRSRPFPIPPPVLIPFSYSSPPRCQRVLQCPLGKAFDSSRCHCVCITQVSLCPGRQTYNYGTCKCECPVRLVCNQLQRRNEQQCRCDPIYTLPYPYNIQVSAPPTLYPAVTCPASTRFLCNSRQTLNQRTCRCECSRSASNRCTLRQVLDPSTCECVCRRRRSCPSLFQTHNSNTCKCECGLVYVSVQIPRSSSHFVLPPYLSRANGGRIHGKRSSHKIRNSKEVDFQGLQVLGNGINKRRTGPRQGRRPNIFIPQRPYVISQKRLVPGPCPFRTIQDKNCQCI